MEDPRPINERRLQSSSPSTSSTSTTHIGPVVGHFFGQLFEEASYTGSSSDLAKLVEKGLDNLCKPGNPLTSTFNPTNETPEEIAAKRQYVRDHRLFPRIAEFINQVKTEYGVSPLDYVSYSESLPQPGTINFGLDEFLHAQGIDLQPPSGDDPKKNQQRSEFLTRVDELKERYQLELDKLDTLCNTFCSRVVSLLEQQSVVRPVSVQELKSKVNGVQQKFDFIRSQLRQNVCAAIIKLQKQYGLAKKKRKSLSKKATEILTNWFFEHIVDPYPSEEEKILLAAGAGLTITQVNNWFGNKRIRYKRKCLDDEKRGGSPIQDESSAAKRARISQMLESSEDES